MDFSDLKDKSVIVTGGARGIGRAVVQAFAEAGADVVIGDLRLEDAKATALEISEASGRRVVAVQTDVTDHAAVERLRDETLRLFGKDRCAG